MSQAIIQWVRKGHARALAVGVAFILLLTIAGCSESENDPGAGSESGSSQTTQQTTVEETTAAPTTTTSERQQESEDDNEDQDQQASSGGGAAASGSAPDSDPQQSSNTNEAPGSRQATGSGERASGQEDSVQEDTGLASRGQVVTVTRVVDGDTIEVSPAVDGIQDVRLIGVDTPETYGGEEPLGPQASAFTETALEGQKVALEFGEERVDPYGRALAHVWVSGGGMFNAQLLREGLAQVATFPPNTEYVNRFESIQADARAAGIGIWGLPLAEQCQLADRGNGIGEGSPGCTAEAPAPEPTPEPAPDPAPQPPAGGGGSAPPVSEDNCPSSHPIKGNESSGIYHPPSGGSYDVTNPEVCFSSAGAAEAAGYRAAQN